MKKYSLTGDKFSGHLILLFNDAGWLDEFCIQAELTDEQRLFLYEHLPLKESDMQNKLTKKTKLVITEIPMDLSFTAFWDKYNYKVGSKGAAEKLWNKLNDGNRVKALNAIALYDAFLQKKGYDKIYAERFLSKGYYENTFTI